jgi:hypothetical protein
MPMPPASRPSATAGPSQERLAGAGACSIDVGGARRASTATCAACLIAASRDCSVMLVWVPPPMARKSLSSSVAVS